MPEKSAGPGLPSLTRRSAVIGSAWTVPAVTVLAAAPAYAASGQLALSGLTAAYDTAGRHPERLLVSADVTGPYAAGYTVALTVPQGLFDSAAAAGATGTATGLDEELTIVVPGNTARLETTLDLGATDAPLRRGLRGPGFVLTAVATGAASSEAATATVVEVDPMTFDPALAADVTRASASSITVSATGVGLDPDNDANAAACGRLLVEVRIPADAPVFALEPPVATDHAEGWELLGPRHQGTDWVFVFATTQESHTTWTATDSDRGPAGLAFHAVIEGGADLPPGEASLSFSSDETAFDGWSEGDSKVEQTEVLAAIPA